MYISAASHGERTPLRSRSGVLRQDRLEPLAIDVRVDLGGRRIIKKKHGMHGSQIRAPLEEVGGEAVPQRVRVHVGKPRRTGMASEELPEALSRHPLPPG